MAVKLVRVRSYALGAIVGVILARLILRVRFLWRSLVSPGIFVANYPHCFRSLAVSGVSVGVIYKCMHSMRCNPCTVRISNCNYCFYFFPLSIRDVLIPCRGWCMCPIPQCDDCDSGCSSQ